MQSSRCWGAATCFTRRTFGRRSRSSRSSATTTGGCGPAAVASIGGILLRCAVFAAVWHGVLLFVCSTRHASPCSTQRPAPPPNQRNAPDTGQGRCDGMTGLCSCGIGYRGGACRACLHLRATRVPHNPAVKRVQLGPSPMQTASHAALSMRRRLLRLGPLCRRLLDRDHVRTRHHHRHHAAQRLHPHRRRRLLGAP